MIGSLQPKGVYVGGTFKSPRGGGTFSAGPSVRDGRVQLRIPLVEQLGAQFGAAFSRNGRPLLPREASIARFVFEESIHYDLIRVVTASFANAPTTLGNYVRRLRARVQGARYVQ